MHKREETIKGDETANQSESDNHQGDNTATDEYRAHISTMTAEICIHEFNRSKNEESGGHAKHDEHHMGDIVQMIDHVGMENVGLVSSIESSSDRSLIAGGENRLTIRATTIFNDVIINGDDAGVQLRAILVKEGVVVHNRGEGNDLLARHRRIVDVAIPARKQSRGCLRNDAYAQADGKRANSQADLAKNYLESVHVSSLSPLFSQNHV